MRLVLTIILLCFSPAWAVARCGGEDLIGALPEAEREARFETAATAPYGEGLLWQARRGGGDIVLFGTYHFPHDGTDLHLERLKPLIDRADAVYLEMSNADQENMKQEVAEDPSIMFITEGETLPDLLGEADWQRLSEEMQARAIPAFFAAKFKPIWAALMLGIGPCEARNGAMDGHGIDHKIGEYATEAGIPSRSLEDFRTILTLLDELPREDQLDMIRLFFAWPDDPDDMAYTLRRYYLRQEIALLWAFSEQVSMAYGGTAASEDFQLLERELLINRNIAWINVLRDASPGRNLFVAVGAAHLPGRNGVLRLLEEEGFEISRLPF